MPPKPSSRFVAEIGGKGNIRANATNQLHDLYAALRRNYRLFASSYVPDFSQAYEEAGSKTVRM